MRPTRAALLALLLGTGPALAEDTSLPLVAKVLGGLADGGQMLQGALGKGTVKAIGEGAFEVSFAKGVASYLYTQPDTCRFTQHAQMQGEPTSEARIDFTKVTRIEVRDQGPWEGLNAALISFVGPADMLQVLVGDSYVDQQPAFAFLATSMSVAELQAAADELQRIC